MAKLKQHLLGNQTLPPSTSEEVKDNSKKARDEEGVLQIQKKTQENSIKEEVSIEEVSIEELRARIEEMRARNNEKSVLPKKVQSSSYAGCGIMSIVAFLGSGEEGVIDKEFENTTNDTISIASNEARFVLNHVSDDKALSWNQSLLNEIKDVENSSSVIEVKDLLMALPPLLPLSILSDDKALFWNQSLLNEIKDVENSSSVIEVRDSASTQKMANRHQMLPPSTSEEVNAGDYCALPRAAVLNMKMESRRAELELRRIELEGIRVDEQIDCMMDRSLNEDSDDDDTYLDSLAMNESAEGFFNVLPSLRRRG